MQREHELHRRRAGRNRGVLIILLACVALLFAVTIVKLGPDAKNPSARSGSWGSGFIEWIRG